MHTRNLFPLLASVVSAATNQLSLRDAPADLPHVTSIQYSGNGCPSSAPAVDESGSWNDLTFRMNAFEVSLSSVADNTANCEVHIQAAGAAAGWQVGVKDVYVKGHLVLDPGAELDFFVTTFWSEDAANTVSSPPYYPLSNVIGRRTAWYIISEELLIRTLPQTGHRPKHDRE
ncbi:hypothetical protein BJ170DRAFT_612234 [Xylariales sp. AK1849]|nr:hypothetical protein BJ170DRAFT_612234 [Xylariales sp. AK1849]